MPASAPKLRRALAVTAAGALSALAACGGGGSGGAQSQPGTGSPAQGTAGVRLAKVGEFDSPLYVTAPPGDRKRIFVVEQGGRIRIVEGGQTLERPFLDLSDQVTAGGEQGLLSVAFAPDYRRSGRFYVDYTDRGGDSRVVEYRVSHDRDRADPGSARQVLFQQQPFPNHNGGLLQFGPDGLLYVGFGDGGSAGDPERNGQRLSTWLGKLLRIDPRRSDGRAYTVPSSNPFVGRAGARPEIYSYGLRNPWRFSFDARNGALWIGDVGQDTLEEVDHVPQGGGAGANFGWSAFEGTRRFNDDQAAPGAIRPVYEYGRDQGCSITGGYVARRSGVPAVEGRYLFGDYCRGELEALELRGGGSPIVRDLGLKVSGLSSFGVDARDRLYAVSLEGPVYRLTPGQADQR